MNSSPNHGIPPAEKAVSSRSMARRTDFPRDRTALCAMAFTCLAALASASSGVLAQPRPAPDPGRLVDAALGHDHAELRRAERHAGGPHDWRIPLRTRRGACYEILAQASGTSRVSVTVLARRARMADPVSMATTTPARARFCATLPGTVYAALVHTEGPTSWVVAQHVAPERMNPNASSAPSTAPDSHASSGTPSGSPSPSSSPEPTWAIGGVEVDFVGRQLRAAVEGRTARAIVPAERVELGTNQAHAVDLRVVASHCILVVAAAVPSASDLDLELQDPAGNRVAEDAGHRGIETLSYCPPYSGTYRLQVRMFSGHGLTGIQAFEMR